MQMQTRTKSGGNKSIVWLLIAAIAIVVIAALAWMLFAPSGAFLDNKGKKVTVEVKTGAGTADIASSLANSGVISNELLFRIQARLTQSDGQFKAGVYKIEAGESLSKIIEELKKGPQAVYVTVTIPEGKTIAQIGQILEKEAGINGNEFIAYAHSAAPELAASYPVLKDAYNGSLEGYLFPDTYRITETATPQKVADMMVKRFNEVFTSLDIPAARAQKYTTNQLITIASLVEREVASAKDRPLVASVIDNRLAKGMKLQFCSSVQFLLPGEEERTKVRLTNADISISSPYNTYKNKGLPPGPIANPGKAALEAAIQPAQSNYLFFQVVDKNGTTKFDKTAADFQRTKTQAKAAIGK